MSNHEKDGKQPHAPNVPQGPVAQVGSGPDPALRAFIVKTIIESVKPEALLPGVIPQ
jgi:hypothetical protein